MSNDDQTERQARERSREALRKKFEAVFESAHNAIFVVDVENDAVVDCNAAAEELVEYSRSELRSMPASDLHPHNLDEFMAFAERVLERGEGRTDEITCYCKSGDIIPAEMSATVIELDGRPHLVNHVRETTGRAERDWFEALIEHSTDLITVVNGRGTIRYQSSSIDAVLGYDPGELRGEVFFEFVHPDEKEMVREVVDRMADHDASAVERVEFRFRRADGSWAWLEAVVSHRPDASVTGFVVNARDVTSRKESRQQAAVLNRMLRHNLRNGLNVIIGHAQPLVDAETPAVANSAETIVSTAWSLHDATSYAKDLTDILESTRISQSRQDVAAIVDRIVDRLSGSGSGSESVDADATFDVDAPETQPVMAAPKLSVAIDHVVRNAVEHNDADRPRVAVTVDPPTGGEYVEVTVADNGPGIPEHEREVLREGERPLKHGSGLGLWIVNWIITRSGGRIEFEENEPRGSRVTLALPPVE
ncbi:MAG: PAS domain S-box protein [Salinirussus sp.]